MNKALVLGGGGTLGVAWEVGLLAGLADTGTDVTDADIIVGTSAGSYVGARIAQGQRLSDLVEEQRAPVSSIPETMEFDLANVVAAFGKWASFSEMTEAACAEVGAIALASRTMPEQDWVDSLGVPIDPDWPDRALLITTVDAESGKFRTWSRDDGIDIRRAVATSCAVPGLFPCVEFEGRKHTDGGVRSCTSADLATGYDSVLIIAPLGVDSGSIHPLVGRQARDEADALRASGANVELIFPDADALSVMSGNFMDASKRSPTVDQGLRQARVEAGRVQAVWAGAPARSS